ncbi:MAG: redox-sensing transcriptional repressor Rex [Clostridiales bacterium]|jgi:redox-sensing transcriptional repressor|nr:redox-sensing transcriptional repressor Rex [Clostridiales bacterium]
MPTKPMSITLCNRLISYLRFIKQLPPDGHETVSSTVIASALNVNDVQVRKDLASVSNRGKPKIGYVTAELIAELEQYLGYNSYTEAALVGAGKLGQALMSYKNFELYGLKIIAAFDSDPKLEGTAVGGVWIFAPNKIVDLCQRLNVAIGIITTPSEHAQSACDLLVAGSVRAIWNFAPVNLRVPHNVIVKNEDMAGSLAVLMSQLANGAAKNSSKTP